MTCAELQCSLSLYLYGELDFAAEEAIESHLDECAFCQLFLNREKEWHAAVNRQQQDVRPEWLAACRKDLYQQIGSEPTNAAQWGHRAADWLRGWFDFRMTGRSYRLAAVSFLLMLGFGAGRMMNSVQLPWQRSPFENAAGFLQPAITQVQEIQPESGNRVRITLQQMRVQQISGNRNDDGMRSLLLGATRESVDPGIRMDSVAMLAGQSGADVRDALVTAIKNDSNAAVRVKAIESLRQFPSDLVTREALEYALAHDHDAGVRTEAMDVLVPSGGSIQLTPQLEQTLMNVMQASPDDDYLRFRCAQILHVQASPNGIY